MAQDGLQGWGGWVSQPLHLSLDAPPFSSPQTQSSQAYCIGLLLQHSEVQTYALHTYQLIKPHPLRELSYPTNFTARLRNAAPSPEPGTPLINPQGRGGAGGGKSSNPSLFQPAGSALQGPSSFGHRDAAATRSVEMLSGRHEIKPLLLSEPW